jgi:hypothetical protein
MRSALLKNFCDSARGLFTSWPAGTRLPMPGIAAIGSFTCAGSVAVKPSLTKITDLRPSRMPPSFTEAPCSAVIVTSLRTCSTICAG